MKMKTYLLSGLTFFIVLNAYAQIPSDSTLLSALRGGAILTGVPFLMIAPDSRAGAMGDIGAGTSADLYSQHWNPAKYPYIEDKAGFSLTYSPWLRALVNDMNLLYFTGYYKIDDRSAVSASITYFSMGEVIFRKEQGEQGQPYRPNEFAIDAAYSRKLTDNFSMAVAARYIMSNLTGGYSTLEGSRGKAAHAGAADVSMFYTQDFAVKNLENSTLGVGLSITNLGSKISYSEATRKDFLPANLRIGVAYNMQIDEYNKVAIAADVNKLLVPTAPVYAYDSITGDPIYDNEGNQVIAAGRNPDVNVMMGVIQSWYDAPGGFKEEMQEWTWSLGAEYWYRDILAFRAGYFHESKWKGHRQYVTVGLGLKFSIVSFDMSYLVPTVSGTSNPLKNTLRFSLGFNFGEYMRQRRGK
ncbi:MAG: type IX secretion system outer membrane channel protein PorV [Bacteroidales bacterium]|jgi:hypothetical protein|nr:type IX secretion system outer membrane channel protein PorV [Bacteroidales bacterium]